MVTKRRPWRTVGIHMEQLMRPINVKMRRGALKLSLGARVGTQKKNSVPCDAQCLVLGENID